MIILYLMGAAPVDNQSLKELMNFLYKTNEEKSFDEIIYILVTLGMPKDKVIELIQHFSKRISPVPKGYLTPENITKYIIMNSFSYEEQRQNPIS